MIVLLVARTLAKGFMQCYSYGQKMGLKRVTITELRGESASHKATWSL